MIRKEPRATARIFLPINGNVSKMRNAASCAAAEREKCRTGRGGACVSVGGKSVRRTIARDGVANVHRNAIARNETANAHRNAIVRNKAANARQAAIAQSAAAACRNEAQEELR